MAETKPIVVRSLWTLVEQITTSTPKTMISNSSPLPVYWMLTETSTQPDQGEPLLNSIDPKATLQYGGGGGKMGYLWMRNVRRRRVTIGKTQ
jgi:hypothetical protein